MGLNGPSLMRLLLPPRCPIVSTLSPDWFVTIAAPPVPLPRRRPLFAEAAASLPLPVPLPLPLAADVELLADDAGFKGAGAGKAEPVDAEGGGPRPLRLGMLARL